MLKYDLKAGLQSGGDVLSVKITVFDQYGDVAMQGQIHWDDGVTIWQSELISPFEWMDIAIAFNAALVEGFAMITTPAKDDADAPIPFVKD